MTDAAVGACSWEFVTIHCADGLDLDALWVSPRSPAAAVIHIHGKGGNFYHNRFLRKAYHEYACRGIALLAVNTRGNGGIVEADWGGQVAYVGSAFETLEASILDVEAAVTFAEEFVDRVILQGHSYGCDKIVYFGRSHSDYELVLISPANSAAIQRAYTADVQVSSDLNSASDEWDLAPKGSYGVRTARQTYEIPVSVGTLRAMANGVDWKLFDHSAPPIFKLENRAVVLLGESDDLQLGAIDRMEAFCEEMLPNAHVFRQAGADHHFGGCEGALCATVMSWIGEE
jgi:pimeloyl-ACP methyl ester carboxylesterase